MADKQASQNKENASIKVIILLGECQYPTLVLDCGLYLKVFWKLENDSYDKFYSSKFDLIHVFIFLVIHGV